MDILLSDYSYLKNNKLALAEAIRSCENGDTIHLGGGIIEIDNMFAVPQIYYLPRYSNAKKYYAFYLENLNDVTIDGDGAKLVFDGDVSPFGFKNCKNITLKNFKIDYKMPHFVQGFIKKAAADYMDIKYNSAYCDCHYDKQSKKLKAYSKNSDFVLDISSCLTNEFETDPMRPVYSTPDYFLCTDKVHPVYRDMSVLMDVCELGDNLFRFKFNDKKVKHNEGNYIVQADHERRNSNFQFMQCENIYMENIDMYASASFGIIVFLCKDFRAKNVNSVICPDSGRALAVNADVFHIVNTRGTIKISDCIMENNMDDSLNIHSLFSVVRNKINKKTLVVDFTYLAKKALNLYSEGERVDVLDKYTFQKRKTLTVVKSELLGDYCLRVQFDEDIGDIEKNDLLESADAKPEVYLNNCRSGNNRGRGFLVPAGRKTVIENCVFYNLRSGIDANGASLTYLEGSAINGLVVRNNSFCDCARRQCDYPINIRPMSIDARISPPYHSNISICNNNFVHNGRRFINIECASKIKIKDNTYDFNEKLPPHSNVNDSGITCLNCTEIDVEPKIV